MTSPLSSVACATKETACVIPTASESNAATPSCSGSVSASTFVCACTGSGLNRSVFTFNFLPPPAPACLYFRFCAEADESTLVETPVKRKLPEASRRDSDPFRRRAASALATGAPVSRHSAIDKLVREAHRNIEMSTCAISADCNVLPATEIVIGDVAAISRPAMVADACERSCLSPERSRKPSDNGCQASATLLSSTEIERMVG
mmetsp:Transcript_66943/g.200006  ORF Transcript_66943/g.200006 Transcript_66943/m.200006 type:complete len:205 (-) Transcript_66943:732-1346(-)